MKKGTGVAGAFSNRSCLWVRVS